MFKERVAKTIHGADLAMFMAVNNMKDVARDTFSNVAAVSPAVAAVMLTTVNVMASAPSDDSTGTAKKALQGVLAVVYAIINIIGIILTIVGIVSFAISYYQEDAAGKNRAAMTIATGIVLLILKAIIKNINPVNWIDVQTTLPD
jgi:hypothetical protein